MDETTTALADRTPGLNKALASLQAELPHVGKDQTAKAGQYSYDYADLAAVSKALMPLLGKHGLAFIARPTLTPDGFALAYSLLHESGEGVHGSYPLPTSGTPQQVGSAISYARRYCLCAVTGLAPGGDDDDGAAAEQAAQTAGGAWESASRTPPAKPASGPAGNRSDTRPNGTVTRPAQRPQPPQSEGEPDPDAQQYADEAHEALTLDALKGINAKAREAHKLAALIRDPASKKVGGLGQYIGWRKKQLEDVDAALRELQDAVTHSRLDVSDLDAHVKTVTGVSTDEASAAQLRQAAEALKAGAPA